MGKARRSRRGATAGRPSGRPAGAAFAREAPRPSFAASGAASAGPADAAEVRRSLHRLLTDAFASLDRQHGHGFDEAVATVAALCGEPRTSRTVVVALLDSLTAAATQAWGRGWQPTDLHRLVGRRLGAPEQDVVVDVMSHELDSYAPATVDRGWAAQLRELDGGVRWPRSSTWIEARRAEGLDWFTLVSRSVTVLHLMAGLPVLEQLTALPGAALPADGAGASGGESAPAVDERILSRVRMLLAKAESTTFEAEAETFTAGAQSLIARHSIDAALLARATPRAAGDGPGGRRIGIDNPYDGPKALLLQAVVSANRCRMVWTRELGFGTVVGFEPDLEAVEVLYTSLLVQATRAMASAGSRSDPFGGSRTRSFRQSFLTAFAERIGERLHEATVAEEAAALDRTSGQQLVPVLAARAEEVDDVLSGWFPEVRRTSVSSGRDAEGWHFGRAAADHAQLGSAPGVGA